MGIVQTFLNMCTSRKASSRPCWIDNQWPCERKDRLQFSWNNKISM